jgi:glycosyltransferase involved in cell wall biosynthesis
MKINIIAWNGLAQSYALVAESYCKGLMQCPENEIFFTDNHNHSNMWKKTRPTIFDNLKEPTEKVDVSIKFVYPFDITPDSNARYTIIFMTCEFNYISCVMDTYELCDNVFILTPSEYSKKGLVSSGFPAEKVFVVPHGYDRIPTKFTKEQLRKNYNIPTNDFIFYHCGSMTANKNISSLLIAFEMVYRGNNNVTLLLKGVDNIYGSYNLFLETCQTIQKKTEMTCHSKILYIGNEVSYEIMAEFYELADCYVSPFLAEGFNLPVLEAACHGLEVICTRGGPPDEFAKDALFIDSNVQQLADNACVNGNEYKKTVVIPKISNLFELMCITMLSHKKIDTTYYQQNYSIKAIGQLLTKTLKKIIQIPCIETSIILFDNKNTQSQITNLLMYCGKYVTIYIISTSDHDISIANKISSNTIVYIKSEVSEKDMTNEKLKKIMYEKHINSAVYMTTDVLILCDPRGYILMNKLSDDTHVYLGNELIMRVLYLNSQKNIEHHIDNINISDCQNTKEVFKIKSNCFKWIPKHDGFMSLYKLYDTDDSKCNQKINFARNDIKVNPETFLMYIEDVDPIVEILRKVKIAIILMGLEEKYEKVVRSAPLTLIYDPNTEKQVYDSNLEKSPIFVYPEALDHFFSRIYPLIKTKFTLYLTYDSLPKDEVQKRDTRHIIEDIIYGRKNEENIK